MSAITRQDTAKGSLAAMHVPEVAAAAFLGTIPGVWLRPWFGLEVRRAGEA